MEVDTAAYCKHQLNMHDRHNINGFNQSYQGGEAVIQSVMAHNIHKNISQIQEGGTSLLLLGLLAEQLAYNQPGKDETGLVCWSVMTLKGDRVQTTVV